MKISAISFVNPALNNYKHEQNKSQQATKPYATDIFQCSFKGETSYKTDLEVALLTAKSKYGSEYSAKDRAEILEIADTELKAKFAKTVAEARYQKSKSYMFGPGWVKKLTQNVELEEQHQLFKDMLKREHAEPYSGTFHDETITDTFRRPLSKKQVELVDFMVKLKAKNPKHKYTEYEFDGNDIIPVIKNTTTDEAAKTKLELAKKLLAIKDKKGNQVFSGSNVAIMIRSAQTEEIARIKLRAAANLLKDQNCNKLGMNSYDIARIVCTINSKEDAKLKTKTIEHLRSIPSKYIEINYGKQYTKAEIVDITVLTQTEENFQKLKELTSLKEPPYGRQLFYIFADMNKIY